MGHREVGCGHTRHTRRKALLGGSTALAALAFLRLERLVAAAPLQQGEVVLPWIDQPAELPPPAQAAIHQQLVWEQLDSWITPADKFFTINHLGFPTVDMASWRLDVGGLVKQSMSLSLDQVMARPRQEVTFTIECSGNTGLPFFWGGIGNATWAGTPLAPLLQEAGVLDQGREVVFYGHDAPKEKEKVGANEVSSPFARSMAIADAMNPNNLLVYEMNGAPLDVGHGAPLRLLLPGWFGIANVKWLDRIEVIDTRFMGHFMTREYVTVRDEQREGQTVTTERSVGRALLKSAPARVSRADGGHTIAGAAWGAPIASVEVQVDGGPWMPATITEGAGAEFAWKFWSLSWPNAAPGEHTLTSRATDTAGNVQPAMTDPQIANKKTYWESNGQITRRVQIG
jgi:DMSO/TMAO reductase YedYZ molybdopterin-dependent catalytic subunit